MSNDMVLNPTEVLEQLKAGAKSLRTQRSLAACRTTAVQMG